MSSLYTNQIRETGTELPLESANQTLSWFNVTDEVKHLLKLATEHWEDTTRSEQYMTEVLAIANNNPDVLIAAYRYFFYKNNSHMALQVAEQVVAHVVTLEQLPDQWNELKPILISRKEESVIRLYLNAYSASGLLRAKLGDLEQAKEIATRVQEIDDRKEFGAEVVLDILTHPIDDDD